MPSKRHAVASRPLTEGGSRSPPPLLESGMLRITTAVAGAWFLLAPLTAVAATALQLVPTDANAINQSAQRYAQNNAVRTQPPAARKTPQALGPAQVYLLRGFLNVFSL